MPGEGSGSGGSRLMDAWSGVLGGDAGSSPPRPLPLNSEEPTISSRSCHISALPLTLCDFRSNGVSSLENGAPRPRGASWHLARCPQGGPWPCRALCRGLWPAPRGARLSHQTSLIPHKEPLRQSVRTFILPSGKRFPPNSLLMGKERKRNLWPNGPQR